MIPSAPAPWSLTGNGYILLFKFPADFVESVGEVPPFLKDHFRGGFGTVMLVDYQSSPVGPYQEALFVPGVFGYHGRNLYSVTKIYVSSMASVVNGQRNWGIPKALADFHVEQSGTGFMRFCMRVDGSMALDLRLRTRRLNLPLNTAWSPYKPALIQKHEGQQFITTPGGRGTVRLAELESATVNPAYFPDFSQFKPVITLKAENFNLIFPKPEKPNGA